MSTLPGQIVYFGDSLTDNNNLYSYGQDILLPFVVNALAGPTGAASDGPTHAQYTADLTGVATQNYAVASAEVDGIQTLGDVVEANGLEAALIVPDTDPLLDTDINLAGQVDRFLVDSAGSDLSQTTAFIWIGGNDYGAIDPTADDFVEAVLAKMNAIIQGLALESIELANAGVDNIVIATQPSASFFAASSDYSAVELIISETVFDTHNAYLSALVDWLVANGIDAELLDMRSITDAIVDDPTGFGLIAPYGDTLEDSNVLDDYDADQVAFYDDIHPSTATHGVIGAFNAMALAGATITQGSDGDDHNGLDDGVDFASGLAGADWIRGKGGNDVLIGGTGGDDMAGQKGDDLISGGQDADLLRGCAGHDILGGGWGDDVMIGGRGNDVLIDGLGNDEAYGLRGNDTFIFTEASLIGGSSGPENDLFDGGDGSDQLIVVLSTESYVTWSATLESGAPDAALAALGITTISIENIVAIDGRDGLTAFAGESWYDAADVWGLI